MGTRKSITEAIAIKAAPDIFAALDGIDLSTVKTRKDFGGLYDRLFKTALRASPRLDSKQILESCEVARRCVDSWAKAYALYQAEDATSELERRFDAAQAQVLEALSKVLSAEQLASLRQRLSEGGDGA